MIRLTTGYQGHGDTRITGLALEIPRDTRGYQDTGIPGDTRDTRDTRYQGQPLTIDNLEQAVDRNGLEPRENGVARSIE